MATQTSVQVPSSDRVEPGSFPLRLANLPSKSPPASDANSVAESWVASFNKALDNPELASVSEVFLAESYWRDQLCLSWDFRCFEGPEKITGLLKQSENGSRIKSVALDKSSGLRSPRASLLSAEVNTVQAFLTIKTDVGHGQGVVTLVNDNGEWKAFTLFTSLEGLSGQAEATGKKRPNGVEHGEHVSRKNWLDRRKAEEEFEDGEEPTVLILGKSN